MTGESYAGHYIPVVTHHIWHTNQAKAEGERINLAGMAIGNGMCAPPARPSSSAYPTMTPTPTPTPTPRLNPVLTFTLGAAPLKTSWPPLDGCGQLPARLCTVR